MGGKPSVPNTPLACMLQGFESYFKGYPNLTKERLKFLCKNVWPTMGTGWPPEGSFKEEVADDLWGVIAVDQRKYPDQFPYIDQWVNALSEHADDLLQCQAEMVRLCVARPNNKESNTVMYRSKGKVCARKLYKTHYSRILKEDGEDVWPPFPPPPPTAPPLPPYQPPAGNGAVGGAEADDLGNDKGENRDGEGSAGLQVKASSSVSDLESETEEQGAAGGHVREEGAMGVQTRARAAKAKTEAGDRNLFAPLRQVDQQVYTPQGNAEIRSMFQYVPFTTTDLLNWKQNYGPLSEKPTEMADLFHTIMQTHNPTWTDIQQLFSVLLTPEEREKWKAAVRQNIRTAYPNDADFAVQLPLKFPETDPGWNPREADQMTRLKDYQNTVVAGLRRAGKPPVNMSKPSLVLQKADESPESFLQRLVEAYQLYTQIDPRSAENVRMLNERFIGQSYEDIRKKLQKLEGALGKNTSELLEVARKVYVNRDKVEKREKEVRMQKKAELLAVALQGGMSLGPNQCAYCKGEGHWQRECPKRMRGRGAWRGSGRQMLEEGGREGRGRGRYPGRGMYRGGRGGRPDRGLGNSSWTQGERETMGLADAGWSD